MGRIPRYRMGDGIYHVYNRSLNSAMILNSDKAKELFCDIIRCKLEAMPQPLNIYHYCVMGNHFHLAVEVHDIRVLSSFISRICSSYSKAFRHFHELGGGPLWQGRYRSILIQKEKYLYRLGRYIEQNPVRAKLTAHAGEWKWSSANCYLTGENDGIVNPANHPLFNPAETTLEDFRRNYLEYLQETSEEDLTTFREETAVIGDEAFQSKTASICGRRQIRRGRPIKTNILSSN